MLANTLHNNNTLIGLNLYSNRLFDKGLHPLVRTLSINHSVLQKLHLGSNRISNEGALLLAEMLKTNTMLTVLWLDSNRIGNEGVHCLANVLIHQNKTLQELSLKKNKLINTLSIQYFIDLCQSNQTLTELDISECSLTNEDNRRLVSISNKAKHFIFRLDIEEGDCVIA
jgi:Ran GTPase-activating protein (RanGAP) involved in mRNA processing and transport